MNAYAAQLVRENACLHTQWRSFCFILADSLTRLSAETWTPDHPDEAHSARHYAVYTVVRADGFRLRLASQAGQGVASMDWPNERRAIRECGVAPLPFSLRNAVHVFDPASGWDVIAKEILARVVEPMEPLHAKIVDANAKRERLTERLAASSEELAGVVGAAAADPKDREGRTHLLHHGYVFGRLRLGLSGTASVEINGLSHATVIAIAKLIMEDEAGR